MAGITPPNFTQIPNEILDKMAEMTPAEFKVLVAICRKTFGWQKERDVISLSQLEELTGLSRTAVQAGIMAAIKRGVLERTKAGTQAFSYHLLVASDYQSTETTSSLSGTAPVASDYQELVVSDYTQKKDLNKLKHSGGVGAKNDAAAALLALRVDGRGLTERQAKRALAKVPDLTVEDVAVWADYLPTCTADSPIGFMLHCFDDGDRRPRNKNPRSNGRINGHTNGLAPPRRPQPDLHEATDEHGDLYLALPDGSRWESDDD